MAKVLYLSADDIVRIHERVVEETGGSHGIRDYHTIATLEDLPKQSAFGSELYPTLFVKAALYVRNIITAHPFVDGNKRTAMTSADVFLQLNGFRIAIKKGGVETFALSVISERKDLKLIADWLKKYSKKI